MRSSSVATSRRTREGNDVSNRFQFETESAAGERDVEIPGNSRSRTCLIEAVDDSQVQRKVLAAEIDMTEAQFSKSLSGIKGGDFNYVLDHIRPSIRQDYLRRMGLAEREGGLEELAAEALAHAAVAYLAARRKRRPVKAEMR